MKDSFSKLVHSFIQGRFVEVPFIAQDGRLGHFKIEHDDLLKAIYKLWLKY